MTEDYRQLIHDALLELRRSKARIAELEQAAASATAAPNQPSAIVGLGCRLPADIDDPAAAWRFFVAGGDAIQPPPTDRWLPDDVVEPVPPGAFLRDPFGFDAAMFRIPPREARLLDPQQRLLLEVAHATFEHAGIAPHTLRGSDTGVFVGISTDDWAMQLARHLPAAAIDGCIGPGANACGAAGRLSYAFGLQGPSLAINTACSSSLVALHLAQQALRRGECELALVLGVNVMLSPFTTATFTRGSMLAPDGRCKTFAADADGYGRGEGAVALLLATPAARTRLGLCTHAELLGSAINQDGATAGLTVPSGPAQQRVVRQALRDAGVAADAVQYVEAHGTGTLLGDPIEVQALAAVHADRGGTAPLWLGSAKTNFGHLEAAAGLLGVLKTVLQLQHRTIAPHRLEGAPNPHLPWSRLPLRIPRRAEPWPDTARPLAGVSAFSFTGTNAHVVLAASAAADATSDPTPPAGGAGVLPLSAHTPAALRAQCRQWAAALSDAPADLRRVQATASHGRDALRVRLAALADEPAALRQRLLAAAEGEPVDGVWLGTVGNQDPPSVPLHAGSTPAAIAQAFVRGARVPWTLWLPRSTRPLPLPTYPFQRRPFRAPTAPEPAASRSAPTYGSVRASVSGAGTAARPPLLLAHVQTVIAAVLQLAIDDVDADAPLGDLGFDSLRAVELATRLENDLGVPLPLAELFDGATPRDVAAALARSWPTA